MSAKIHTLNSAKNASNAPYKALVADIASCLNKKLSELLTNMFNSADDSLFLLAETADTNTDKSQSFDTMRMLRLQRKDITQKYAQALKEYLKPVHQNQLGEVEELDEDQLMQLDRDEMEERVAVTTMDSKASHLFAEAIGHLEARLEFLAVKTTAIFDQKALQPKHICEAFRVALKDVELTTRHKLILYKLFDNEVVSHLDNIYNSINQLLIDANILPQIKITEPVQKPVQNNIFLTSFSQPEEKNNTEDTLDTDKASKVLNDFIHGESDDDTQSSSSQGKNQQYFDRRDVLKALTNLQLSYKPEYIVGQKSSLETEDFKRALLTSMAKITSGVTLSKTVNQIDGKIIDFIEMVFGAFLDDPNISHIIKSLLMRYQVPVIKMAMLDINFIKNRKHPARMVLDNIAHLSIGIEDKENTLYRTIELITEQLLSSFDQNVISFQTALSSLKRLSDIEQKKQQQKEKQTHQQILQEYTRQVVLSELQYRIGNMEIAEELQPLILKHWSTLMFHRFYRFGKDSDEWNEAVSILIMLLKSLQPISSADTWSLLNDNHMPLVETIEELLHETKQNTQAVENSITQLKQTYSRMLSDSEFRHTEPVPEIDIDETASEQDYMAAFDSLPDLHSEQDTTSPMDQQATAAREKIAQLPANVKPGAWFEIFDGDDRPVRRLKLSVIILEDARLVFVDRLGANVLDKYADIFADELETRKSILIADQSIFDRALGRVIGSLSNTTDT